ncbi:MAG: TonB-dependent receptor, partial [Brevundimonas diminuta]
MSRRSSLLAATALMTVGAGAPALADETTDMMEQTHKVADVVVTASGFEQKITQAPASISVLPREEIQEIRAASIAEILNNIEGVDTGSGVGKTGGQTINIRGMGSDYTLILIDGRRQNTAGSVTPNGFGETANSFLPPVSAIDRIEVVRGPVATLYGSDAMGGVVNIITRKVGDAWTGSASANYTLQGDDEFGDFWGINGYASGPLIADRLGLALRGSWSEREQSDLKYRDVNGNEVDVTGFGRSATAYEIWTLGARLSLTPNADHDLWLDVDAAGQWYDN